MYDEYDIQRLLEGIKEYGLSAPAEMLEAPIEKLVEICNGIGDGQMPTALRKILNGVLNFAECSAAIHDWRYANSDGTQSSRLAADKEFRANMLDEISRKERWFKWLKEWSALRAYYAVRGCGYADWCIAFAEANRKENV